MDDAVADGAGNEALQLINSLKDHADQENRAVGNAAKSSKLKTQMKNRKIIKKLKAK